MIVTQHYMRDRAGKLGLLVGIAIFVHLSYQMVVLPRAEAWSAAQLELVRKQPGYRPERSLFVIIKDRDRRLGGGLVLHPVCADATPAAAARG